MIQLRRTSNLSVDALLPQAERAGIIARAARGARDGLIAARQASPSYRTLVDGRDGATEETIKPGGVIVYRFNTLGQAVTYAVAYAVLHSPAASGRLRRAWFVSVNGRPWVGDLNLIPPGSSVIVANAAPYARKVDVGGQAGAGRKVAENTRQAVNRQYPNLVAEVGYVDLASGEIAGFRVPYKLVGRSRTMAKRAAKRIAYENSLRKKSKRRRVKTVATARRDTREGQLLTYPAIHITARLGFA